MQVKKNILRKCVPIAMIFVTCALLACFLVALFTSAKTFDEKAQQISKDRTYSLSNMIQTEMGEIQTELALSITEIEESINKESAATFHAERLGYVVGIARITKPSDLETYYGELNYNNDLFDALTADRDTTPLFEIEATHLFGIRFNINSTRHYLVVCDFAKCCTEILKGESENNYCPYVCVAYNNGKIIYSVVSNEIYANNQSDKYLSDYVGVLTRNTANIDLISDELRKNDSGVNKFLVNETENAIAFSAISGIGSDVKVVAIYDTKAIILEEYTSYTTIFGAAAGLSALVILLLIYYVIVISRKNKAEKTERDTDILLGCNSFEKFRRTADELINIHKEESYAVIAINISKFNYVKEKLDASQINGFLRFFARFIENNILPGETYGHVADDSFAMLLYCGDSKVLRNRLMVLRSLINNHDSVNNARIKVHLNIGVFKVEDGRNLTINEMLDRAIVAQLNNEKHPTEPYIIYDKNVRSAYIREAEIESKMENALENKEFKVFFQPKYNILNDRIDSAEALVRWYDSEKQNYEAPDLYIPLFEVNGFIVKLDYYVFDSVCKFISESTARGDRVVPIAVNVSRVTAMQKGFVEHYVNQKRQCNIPNGFLIIEFTESFALENNENLKTIVSALKANGFKCSIDDFGSGQSTQSILKSLTVDELKLDKFYIQKSDDENKDEILLKMTIELGKALNMKIVQEGVETLEDLMSLKECGCDVIQGYYYSKPLIMSDFIDFINADTTLSAVRLTREQKEKIQAQKAAVMAAAAAETAAAKALANENKNATQEASPENSSENESENSSETPSENISEKSSDKPDEESPNDTTENN